MILTRRLHIFSIAVASLLSFFVSTSVAFAESEQQRQEDTYRYLETFAAVLSILQENYVEEIKTKDAIEGAIDGLLLSLDPHSSYLKPENFREFQEETSGEFTGIGIEITLKDGIITVISPIEDTPAYQAGIKANDKIIKINGEITKGKSIFDAVQILRGPKGTEVTISIFREGWKDLQDFKLIRDVIPLHSVKSMLIKPGFGYVRIANFQRNTTDEVKEHLRQFQEKKPLQGLILDLRNNPGGLLDQAVSVSDIFLDGGLIVYTKGRKADQDLTFEAHNDGGNANSFPLVVLVNEGSASAAEIVAGALQDHQRGVLVGAKTFGKGSVQTIIPLADGAALRMTTALYYTPKGRSIQATGIEPDIVIEAKNGKQQEGPQPKVDSIREADLEHHFANKDESPADRDQELSDDMQKTLDGDNQLRSGFDILKSLVLFTSFRNGNAPKTSN